MDLYDLFFSGYNPVNTIIYGLSLGFLGLLFVNILRRLKYKLDKYTYLSITPFILLAATVRVLIDAKVFPFSLFLVGFLGVITFGVLFLAILIISLLIQKKFGIKYYKSTFLVGIILVVFHLNLIRISEPRAFTSIIAFTFFLMIPMLLIQELYRINFFRKNLLPLSSNVFNSVTNFVGSYYFGYGQKHVIQKLWISLIGNPFLILLLNIALAFPILYALGLLEKDYRRVGRLIIFALTFGPGLRNMLRIGMGV